MCLGVAKSKEQWMKGTQVKSIDMGSKHMKRRRRHRFVQNERSALALYFDASRSSPIIQNKFRAKRPDIKFTRRASSWMTISTGCNPRIRRPSRCGRCNPQIRPSHCGRWKLENSCFRRGYHLTLV